MTPLREMDYHDRQHCRDDLDRLRFRCPGCNISHEVWVSGSRAWGFNGDLVAPTITPSILVTWPEHGKPDRICHSFVTAGLIRFLADSTHKLAGKTVLLPEYDPDAVD